MSTWILDSEKGHLLKANGDTIECANESCGTVINALYVDHEQLTFSRPGKYYFEFECDQLKDSLFVGLTTKEAFKPGYAIKGFFFGGNLSDGSCLLVGCFGKPIKNQARIGIIVDLTDQQLRIYIVQDGLPLGLAYRVTAPYSQPLYPVVHFCGSGRVRIVPKSIDNLDQLLERRQEDTSTIAGHWELQSFIKQGQPQPVQNKYRLKTTWEDDGRLHLSIRVINTVGCIVTVDQQTNQLSGIENLFTTLMAGPPEMMHDEHQLSAAVATLNKFRLSQDCSQLWLIGPNIELQFQRYIEHVPAYEKDPILSN